MKNLKNRKRRPLTRSSIFDQFSFKGIDYLSLVPRVVIPLRFWVGKSRLYVYSNWARLPESFYVSAVAARSSAHSAAELGQGVN